MASLCTKILQQRHKVLTNKYLVVILFTRQMVGLVLKAAINILGDQPELPNHETASTVLARPSSTLNEKLKA